MKLNSATPFLVAAAACLATGCISVEKTDHHEHRSTPAASAHAHAHASAWQAANHAIAVIRPTAGNQCAGTVHFIKQGEAVKVVAEVSGLKPNQAHGFHIHELGDVSAADGLATGGHYNPEGHSHALPASAVRHAGDFGNLQADGNGNARLELVVDNLSIAGLRNPVLGRAVIVHAQPDDGSQPTGNAGARIGQGVIGLAKNIE